MKLSSSSSKGMNSSFVLIERFLGIHSDPSKTAFVLLGFLSTLVNEFFVDFFIFKLRIRLRHNWTNIHVSVFIIAPIATQTISLCTTQCFTLIIKYLPKQFANLSTVIQGDIYPSNHRVYESSLQQTIF